MVVLITGAAGFIGSHLVDGYLAAGHAVIGVDNLCTGTLSNIEHALRAERFSFIEADVSAGTGTLEGDLSRAPRFDLILHFASPASPVDYANLPLETMAANSSGTRHCLELALAHHSRFLYASTSESYGDPLEHPQKEGYWGHVNPVGTRSCYDESKRFGEALTMAYWRTFGIDARVVRIFNTYGPRMREDDGRVVPNFIMQALRGRPLTIYGHGKQTRSFCYIDDLVQGIMRYADAAALGGGVLNLGNPDERSVAEFAAVVSEIAGVPLKFTNVGMPEDDPARRCPDITKAKELLGWEPAISLHEGVARTIAHFRSVHL